MAVHWLVLITFTIAVIQSFIFGRWGLKNIGYARYFSTDAVFEGDYVEMVEKIYNKKILPVPWLRLESMIDSNLKFQKQFNLDIKHQQHHKSLFSLMPFTRITRRHSIICEKRGCYYLDSVSMTSGDIFGLNTVFKDITITCRLLVYPKTLPYEQIALPSHSWQGDIVVRRWIVSDPFMISGVREYNYGDPLNRINWQATARVGRLQVHNLDFTANHRLMIYMNIDISEEMWSNVTEPERIEKGISCAATISQYAILHGIETGFGCNGYMIDEPKQPVRVLPRCSKEHLTSLFEVMARLVIDRSVTFFTFLEEDIKTGMANTDFLFITSYVSERMQGQIDLLKNHANSVEIFLLE